MLPHMNLLLFSINCKIQLSLQHLQGQCCLYIRMCLNSTSFSGSGSVPRCGSCVYASNGKIRYKHFQPLRKSWAGEVIEIKANRASTKKQDLLSDVKPYMNIASFET